jgi:aconitate hydratase
MPSIETTPALVAGVYERLIRNIEVVRRRLERPLTYAEKIFLGHFADPEREALEPGRSYVGLRPDRVAMQDATAQMALLQFMLAGRDETAVPSTVHCDHLIQAHAGASRDMEAARTVNREVYDFLRSATARYGIGFWGPGAGIIHQVVLEQYAFPGGMMLGTDSHTPNAGGLGMFACGVGGADAVDVMAGFPWEVLYPKRVGIHLTGQLSGWAAPKDVILKVCGILTVKGGTNRVLEYFGPGASSISCTGKATITNMGAELGATTSIFPFDERMARYLKATGREELADLADRHAELLRADPEVETDPGRFFDEVVEIDLSALEPHIAGPHTPDLARPVSRMARDASENGYPLRLTSALIGSCTNSSYEDLERAANVARQARKHGARARAKLWVTPGSEQIHLTIQRDGQMEDFEAIDAVVLANACGPCIGQWKRDDIGEGEENSIINSYNRNFRKRNDGNPGTYSFIASPEVVVAYALAGSLRAGWGTRTRRRTAAASTWRSIRRANGSSASTRSRPGTAGTSSAPRCCSRRRASAPPITSRPPVCGCASADTSRTSATTCSPVRSTPSQARPESDAIRYRGRAACRIPGSPDTLWRRTCAGSWWETRTTEKARVGSTRPCRPGCSAPQPSSCAASRASTRPISRSRACCRCPSRTRRITRRCSRAIA